MNCGTPGREHQAPVRLYPAGWRCRLHTPAAEAGQPEPPEGQGRLPDAWTTPTPTATT